MEQTIANMRPNVSHRKFFPVQSVWNSDGRMLAGTLIGRAVFLVISAYMATGSFSVLASCARSSLNCGKADMTSGPIKAEAFCCSKYILKVFSKKEIGRSLVTIEWPMPIWQWRPPRTDLSDTEGVLLVLSEGCSCTLSGKGCSSTNTLA